MTFLSVVLVFMYDKKIMFYKVRKYFCQLGVNNLIFLKKYCVQRVLVSDKK